MLCTTLNMLDSLVSLVQCTYTNSGFLATVFAYTALKILEPGSLTSPTTKGAHLLRPVSLALYSLTVNLYTPYRYGAEHYAVRMRPIACLGLL